MWNTFLLMLLLFGNLAHNKWYLVGNGNEDLKNVPTVMSCFISSWTEDLCQMKTPHNLSLNCPSLLLVFHCVART